MTRVDVNADLPSNELRSLIRNQCERCAPPMENIDEDSKTKWKISESEPHDLSGNIALALRIVIKR
uniref:Uncharacterized protein n=1 Tax=Parascaris equorum TaxID=6256 RepID=A0A914RD99_PAREQ